MSYRNEFHSEAQRDADKAFDLWYSEKYAIKAQASGIDRLGKDEPNAVFVTEFLAEHPEFTNEREHLVKFLQPFLRKKLQ